MKVRAGYKIAYDCPQPTPMILTLSVHPEPALRPHHRGQADSPSLRADHRICRRLRQYLPCDPRAARPADAVLRFPHQRQRRAGRRRAARAAALARYAPRRHARLSARQPLLRDRPASDIAWSKFGKVPQRLGAGAGDLRFRATSMSRSATSMPMSAAPRTTPISRSGACAATSPISPSRFAAA